MREYLLDVADKLNGILEKNDLSLINKFEDEFIDLEYKNEKSSLIVYNNRLLVRKAYYLVVMLYKEKATLKHLKTLINDTNGEGRKMVIEFSKMKNPNPYIQNENNDVVEWFLNDYYVGRLGIRGGSQTYNDTIPARYILDKMINMIDIRDGVYNDWGKVKPS